MTNYKQLSKEDRSNIEHLLNEGKTFTEIGEAINYDRTTISKEIRRNRYIKSSTFLPHSETGINKAINSCKRLSAPIVVIIVKIKIFVRNTIYTIMLKLHKTIMKNH